MDASRRPLVDSEVDVVELTTTTTLLETCLRRALRQAVTKFKRNLCPSQAPCLSVNFVSPPE